MARAPKNAKPEILLKEVLEELEAHTGISADPVVTHVKHCDRALPQYHVGHTALVASLNTLKPKWLSVSGQAYGFSGVPNCINTSKSLVEYLLTKAYP